MKIRITRLFLRIEDRSIFVLFGLVFWGLLDIGYRVFVSPLYAYSGFVLVPAPIKYLEAVFIYVALLFVLPRVLTKPSDYFMSFLLFGFLAPLLIFYALADQPRTTLFIVLLGCALIEIFRNGRTVKMPFLKHGYHLGVGMLLLSVLAVTSWLFASGGLRYFNLDLSAVYEFRRDVGAIVNVGVMGYLNTWAFKVFGPSLLAIGLWKRQLWLVLAILLLHVVWFGISSYKSVLFYPLLVLFLWGWFSSTRALSLVAVGLSTAVAGSLAVFFLMDEVFIPSMFIRRVFFVIANNTFSYYEFFSQGQFIYWSNSITSAFIDYPYHIVPAELIGEWRGTDSHANNSFLATAYMHAGIPGVVFYGVSAGLLFRLIDSVARQGIPSWVAVAVMIVPSRSLLLSADLPTALLTHGVGMAILVLILLRTRPNTVAPNSVVLQTGRLQVH